MFSFSKGKDNKKISNQDDLNKNDLLHLFRNIGKKKTDKQNVAKQISEDELRETLGIGKDKKNISLPPPPKLKSKVNITQSVSINDFIKTTEHINENLNISGKTFARKFDVYEEGIFLGIKIGKSTKQDVFNILKNYGDKKDLPKLSDDAFSFKDLSLTVVFNKENIVKEITLGPSFMGQTSKGLRIGDTVEQAIKIYGRTINKSQISMKWNNFAIFISNNKVTHIRLEI